MARLITADLHCGLFLVRLRYGAVPLGTVHEMRIRVVGGRPSAIELEIRTTEREDLRGVV